MERFRFRLAPEPLHPYAHTAVQRVTGSEFSALQSLHPPKRKVLMNDYIHSDGNEVILNKGAGPCSLVYVIDAQNGSVFSSHYAFVNPVKAHQEIKRHLATHSKPATNTPFTILRPTKNELADLSQRHIEGGFYSFLEMEDEIGIYINSHDPSTIEAHVFGQNITYSENLLWSKNVPSIRDMAAEQVLLSLRLQHLGLLASHIVDHRTITVDKTDNTLYIPKEHTIYHHEDMFERYDLTADYFHDIFPT